MLLTVQCCWILHASDGIRGCYSQTKHEMPHMEMHSKVWPNIPEDVIQHGSLWAVFFHIERDRWCYLCFLISPFSLSLSGSSCFGGPSSYGADEQPDQSIYLCHLKCWKNMNFEVSKRENITLYLHTPSCQIFLTFFLERILNYRVRKIHVVKAYTSTSNLVTN